MKEQIRYLRRFAPYLLNYAACEGCHKIVHFLFTSDIVGAV